MGTILYSIASGVFSLLSRKDERLSVPRDDGSSAALPSISDHPPETESGQGPPPRKPVIGIPVEKKQADESCGDSCGQGAWGKSQTWVNWESNSKPYQEAVEQFGGKARLLSDSSRSSRDLLEGVDALLIPGGRDIHPKFYGQKADPRMDLSLGSESFDQFEIELVKEALQQGLPIRGICRGLQVLNVAAGGTLIQDISSHLDRRFPYTRLNHRRGEHGVAILRGSRLEEMLEREILMVNSLHHQAVGRIAPGFVPVAAAADQIIEAIEKAADATVLGVQFHPEKARDGALVRSRFFESLIQDARRYRVNLETPSAAEAPGISGDPVAAVTELLERGYKFSTSLEAREMTDPRLIVEMAQRSKLVVQIPEFGEHHSNWGIRDYSTFVETVLVESGQIHGDPGTQKTLELIDRHLERGTCFHHKDSNKPLRSRMSIYYNLANGTLAACKEKHRRSPVPVTVTLLRDWLSEPKAAKAKESDSSKGIDRDTLQKLERGFEALRAQGYSLRSFGRLLDRNRFRRDAAYKYRYGFTYGFTVTPKENQEVVLKCDDQKKLEELLFSLSSQTEELSPKSREILELVQRLKGAGAEFYRKGWVRKKPITFDIEAAWLLQDWLSKNLAIKHPKQQGGIEEVKNVDQLLAILALYQEPPAEPAVVDSKGSE